MQTPLTPLVVQYLYVHEPDEGFYYPSARTASSSAAVATRYLECALTQAATLRLRKLDVELALATNIRDRGALGRVGGELLERIEEMGVRILATEYRHRPKPGTEVYVSSRYVLDAILSSSEGQPAEREIWLTDLDCVWADPELVFASAPPPSEIGCVYIGYPPDWDTVGFEVHGRTRRAIGDLARTMGEAEEVPPWVGGELIVGTPVDAARARERLRGARRGARGRRQDAAQRGADPLARRRHRARALPRPLARRQAPEHRPARPRGQARGPAGDRAVAPALREGAQPAPHRPPDPAAGARAACGATSAIRRARRGASTSPAQVRCVGCATTAGSSAQRVRARLPNVRRERVLRDAAGNA